MAYVEKCDMVWGANGNPVLLRGDFERRLQEEGLTTKRASKAPAPSRSTSALQWLRRTPVSSPHQSIDSFAITGSTCASMSDLGARSVASAPVVVGDVDRRRRKKRRPGKRIKDFARHTGEIGVKIVALPAFVLLDMIS